MSCTCFMHRPDRGDAAPIIVHESYCPEYVPMLGVRASLGTSVFDGGTVLRALKAGPCTVPGCVVCQQERA